ncbi:MAG: crossover junction endodeoxyribonuclease RuvC [Rickettsiales bacterium]
MIILGIDPGLMHTGWAVVDSANNSFKFIAAGVIKTAASDQSSYRLLKISQELEVIIQAYFPIAAAIEETYVNKNYGSSLKLAHARSAAILTLAQNGLHPAEYPAKTIKKTIVGTGRAEKDQVAKILHMIISGVPQLTNDASDALAIAVCHGLLTTARNRQLLTF